MAQLEQMKTFNAATNLMLPLILKYKHIIKMNLNLMVFIQEIIYPKKGWGIYNKS